MNLCYNRHRSAGRLRDRLPRLVAGRPDAADRDIGLRELIERLAAARADGRSSSTTAMLPHDEIAAKVGTTPSNARTILFRARRRLAEQLREANR